MWSGIQKEPEHNLLDAPVAITSFNSENNPKLPSLAVAAGSHVFIYRNLRPYYKFVLPPEDVNEAEKETWWVGVHRKAAWTLLASVAR